MQENEKMNLRKIAANYILLPGFELTRNGYVVLEEGQVTDVVDTGGEIKEIPCLEFYGGMIVADFVRNEVEWQEGDDIPAKIKDCYSRKSGKGLAIIQGADFARFSWLKDTRINPLR